MADGLDISKIVHKPWSSQFLHCTQLDKTAPDAAKNDTIALHEVRSGDLLNSETGSFWQSCSQTLLCWIGSQALCAEAEISPSPVLLTGLVPTLKLFVSLAACAKTLAT